MATNFSVMKVAMSRFRSVVIALCLPIWSAPHLLAQSSPASPPSTCLFSSFYKSSLAWESGLAEGSGPSTPAGRGDLVGRVIAVRDGGGLAGAHIRVSPGDQITMTDSAGRFAIRGLRQGRYLLTVVAPFSSGARSVRDSITVGFDGLRIVASLSSHTGDIVCTGQSR